MSKQNSAVCPHSAFQIIARILLATSSLFFPEQHLMFRLCKREAVQFSVGRK
jgi:hypothetical protein